MASVIRSRRDALRLSDEQTIKFLSCYEKEPVLWNPFLEHYRNRDARAEAAGRIAEAMNVSGFGPEQVIIKFKNLRSSYCQELKKIAASESSGAARDQIYVPQVKWFSQMDSFIKPHVTSRSSLTKYIIPTVEFDESEIENSASCDEYNWDGHSLSDGCVQSAEAHLTAIKKEPACRSSAYHRSKPGEAVSSNRGSPARSQQDENRRDDDMEETFDRFGKYLTSLLRTLPRHKSLALQQQIINLAIAANIDNSDA